MKKETLIKVIDEEFGEGHPISWIIDVVEKALIKNDSRMVMSTDSYQEQFELTTNTLKELKEKLIVSEKESDKKFEVKKRKK